MRPGRDPKICDCGQGREARDGLLDHARHPSALIGDLPPLRTFVGRRRALLLRALPLARARIQLDSEPAIFEWTSEGTDEFLGHGALRRFRSRSPIGVWCRLDAWNQSMETKVGDEEGATRSARTLLGRAGVRGRHCLLTTGGLIGVGRPLSDSGARLRTQAMIVSSSCLG